MEELIHLGMWTIIGSESGWGENVGKVEHAYAKTKAQAYVAYQSMKRVWTNVWVFDEEGDFIDPTEL